MTQRLVIHDVYAICECGWRCDSKNAGPTGKRHAQHHGHVVQVCQELVSIYAPDGMTRDEVSQRMGDAASEQAP